MIMGMWEICVYEFGFVQRRKAGRVAWTGVSGERILEGCWVGLIVKTRAADLGWLELCGSRSEAEVESMEAKACGQ